MPTTIEPRGGEPTEGGGKHDPGTPTTIEPRGGEGGGKRNPGTPTTIEPDSQLAAVRVAANPAAVLAGKEDFFR